MKLSEFIVSEMPQILAEWEKYARTMRPAADEMSIVALRDHAEEMLQAVALDIEQWQSAKEAIDKSKGLDDDAEVTAASIHGALRHASRFSLLQLSSEFRALRAAVLRGWLPVADLSVASTIDAVVRFNEAIDQALAESIVTYSQRADETRDLFLAILGHDMRGPLATVSLAGDLLAVTPPEAGTTPDLASRVKRAARFMTSMVQDMIGFTRTRLGGEIAIVRLPLDVGSACETAVSDAEAMHPSCTYQLETRGALEGSYDGMRLHQVLVNLLGNAGQYGAPGQPVRITATGEADAVCIEVHNAGATIPDESLERIFDPMVRLDPNGDAATLTASRGLGLFVAREIVRAHGGTLTVRSDDAGTVFTVRLPRTASTTASAEPG
jgi:signal transduction histidine kinase